MSKGSMQRPGDGYASGYDRIFGKPSNDSTAIEIEVRGSFAGANGRRVGTWVLKGPKNGHAAMDLREDGSVWLYGVLNHELSAERKAVMLAARDEQREAGRELAFMDAVLHGANVEPCNAALRAAPAGQREAIMGAIGRGYCAHTNSHKAVDFELVRAMTDEVEAELARRSRVQGGHDDHRARLAGLQRYESLEYDYGVQPDDKGPYLLFDDVAAMFSQENRDA